MKTNKEKYLFKNCSIRTRLNDFQRIKKSSKINSFVGALPINKDWKINIWFKFLYHHCIIPKLIMYITLIIYVNINKFQIKSNLKISINFKKF